MAKSKLDNDQWLELFADELAGIPRVMLSAKWGVSTGAINVQARKRGLTKRETGARDHRMRPPGGWPDNEPLPQSAVGMSPDDWRALLKRYQAGECHKALAAEAGVSTGALHNRATDMGMRKKDNPASVYRTTRPEGPAPEPEPDPADHIPLCPPIKLRPAQRAPGLFPDGRDWSTWLFLGGRGAGKTLAGASWLADQAEALGEGGRLALVGPTLHDVREVMIEGPSGLRALPRWTRASRPAFEPSRRRLIFANGCIAHAFSAEDPDSLRGPQFSAAWADEFCAWPAVGARGAGETLALLRMGLRLPLSGSPAPRLVVTTTPRPTRALISLRDEPSCALTHAGTADNADHLSAGFLDGLRALYGGTRREAQEIEGRVVDLDGALFTAEMMMAARTIPSAPSFRGRAAEPGTQEGRMEDDAASTSESGPLGSGFALRAPRNDAEKLERVIVALDPTTTTTGDACGIVVAGARRRPDGVREAVILADRSAHGLSPSRWARRAVRAAEQFGATAMVAEVNQGGDMVAAVLKTAGCTLKVREVRATRGKRVRAEPVAALYEQGRVRHAPADGVPLSALEEELMAFGGEMEGAGSLDRADALVWAVTDLLIDAREGQGPRIRQL
ncbi:MAG TPA: terminase family protein [Brevundimonas sp.]|nr:terminase family protein [Brevundimonas sp.]